MTRDTAVRLTHEELLKNGLADWHVRLTNNPKHNWFLGLCSYADKSILLNAHHLDIHPDESIVNTIKHEVAHALTPGEQHNEIWRACAEKLGCTDVSPCSSLTLDKEAIDAIRSGAEITVTMEEIIVKKPKYEITQHKDLCPHCGKQAILKRETLIETKDDARQNQKLLFLECGHLVIKYIPKGTPFHTLVDYEHRDNGCNHYWNKTTCTKCGAAKLYPFQIDGARFIEAGLAINNGAAVFDEMGLGKTIQALSYVIYHPESGPFLFIVKSALKFQWFKELLKWNNIVAQIIQSSNDILIPQLNHYIISYDILVPKVKKTKKGLITQGFNIDKLAHVKTVILDECQQIKNPDSTRTQQVRRTCKGKKVIALSGTPWKNRGSEFFSVLNMLSPIKFPSFQQYLNKWVDYYAHGNKWKEGGINDPKGFRDYISDIAIRREVSEVMKEMPDVNRTLLYCELDKITQQEYDSTVSKFVEWYNQQVIDGNEDSAASSTEGLAHLTRMRHITGLAKIPFTVEYHEEFFEETDRKLVTFVHHKDVGEILYRELTDKFSKHIPVLKLTGDQSSEERNYIQERFNKSQRAFLVASTLAAGEGLNLQTCSDAIIHERQWNPANEDQAAPGRFRRIGQQASIINVIFPTASGSIDEQIGAIIEGKRNAFHTTMNIGESVKWNQSDVLSDLMQNIAKNFKKGKK